MLFAYHPAYAERVAVSLFTMRKHWQGPILLLLDDATEEIGRRIANDSAIAAETRLIEPHKGCRHCAYITKTLIPQWSPFERTLLIDGDTAVGGNFDELFVPPMAITQFSNWHSLGGHVNGRIKWWESKTWTREPPIIELVNRQLSASWPAINTGIVGWHRGHPKLDDWRELTLAGAGLHMTDEIAMQLLQGMMKLGKEYKVFDDRFNCSPIYGVGKSDARIWHFHGRKHLRKEQGKVIWVSMLREAMAANAGGLREWAGQYDPPVKELLNGGPK